MSLFSELKNRNVFRVAAAYIVVAWLVIQVVETIFPAFGFGDSAIRLVVIVFAIGLVPVLVFSWLFEFTPEGLKREGTVDNSRPVALAAARRFDRAITIILTLAVGFFAFDKFVLDPARDAELEKITTERVQSEALVESYGDSSIAVLPFVNMSEDADNEYFSDGMSEELLNLLARIPRLRVISRSSSFSYKGKDVTIPQVAKQLNVSFVLEGSVRKFGNKLRVTAQLIEARSDTHLWSETYDRTVDDLFAIQDEISVAIVVALKDQLNLDVEAAPKVNRDISKEAHDAVLRGRFLLAQRTKVSMVAAVAEFRKAVALGPDYALAHAELAMALSFAAPDDLTEQQYLALRAEAVEKALALDPGLAEAHAARAFLILESGTGYEAAVESFKHAIELNPSYAMVYTWMAESGMTAGPEEAFAYLEMAIRLDPLAKPINISYIGALIARNRLAEADQQLEAYASIDPRGAIVERGIRTSVGGNWANYVLAYQDAAKSGTDELAFGVAYFRHMLWHLDSMGLEDEALQLAGKYGSYGYVRFENPDDQVQWAQEQLQYSPEFYEAQIDMGLAFANAGRYAEARPFLEKHWKVISGSIVAWHWSDRYADIAEAWFVVLRDSGEEVAANQVLSKLRDSYNRFRKAGIVMTEWDKSVDYREGLAAYLAGEHDAGLALMAKAADDGYWIRPPATYQLAMYQDPVFVAILERQAVRQARERDRVLAVVCTNNPYAAMWQPTEETCKQFLSAATQQ